MRFDLVALPRSRARVRAPWAGRVVGLGRIAGGAASQEGRAG